MLLVGAFESFLSDGFAEHLQTLLTASPPLQFADLPDKLRLSSVFESLKFATSGPRHGAPSGRASRYPDVVGAARRIVDENIDPRALSQTGGNPNSDRVRTMFKDVGIADALVQVRSAFDTGWGSPESSTFLADKLDEIVNTRHVVAHTANALAITRGNLVEWPRFLDVLADVLDERMDRYVCNVVARVIPA